jgi:RNA polymerase sigma-70 factor, ECF subfamily
LSDPRQTDTIRLDTSSEEALARRVQLGCVRSYEELDRRLRPRLVYLLTKRTGNREDAEDLAQQALMRAYQKIDRYNPRRGFRPWLFTIAIRLSIDAHRKRGIRATGEGIERAQDSGPGPAETVSRRDGQRWLWALADRVLDPTQRTALWLHYGEQQNAKEIAGALGITAVHVRVLLYRARRTLMAHLDKPASKRARRADPGPINRGVPVRKEPSLSEGAMT